MRNKDRNPVVLVVDDDKNTRDGLQRALSAIYTVLTAESGKRALDILAEQDVDVLLRDLRMPAMDGLTLLQRALAHKTGLVAILLTAYGNVETAVEAMKRGAYDFLMKPVNLDHLELLLARALRSRDMESENASLREQLDDKFGLENLVGQAPVMRQLFETIKQTAPTQATVLIRGESGTGKELVAQAVHRLSPRAKGPFVAVHCAALSASLLESELFGHEKGSFTGAVARRRGRFEKADGGSLFLDEISEIDPSLQVKLLRVLEEHSFERVGGEETVEVDIRLITATNKDPRELVEQGKFREDLFFRLDVVDIVLPPLRERLGDVPLLCNHFIREFSEKDQKQIEGITAEAMNLLAAYSWPGNVRELRNVVEKMVVLSRAEKLTVRDIPPHIRGDSRERVMTERADHAEPAASGLLADTEKSMILAAVERHGGNRTKAAEALGISRRTLHRKLHAYLSDGPTGISTEGE